MPCYFPLQGYRSKTINDSGKRSIVFDACYGYEFLPVTVPCGKCIGCRLERSRQWAVRCMHEASLHEENCFLTLTYTDENLPPGGSLCKADFQKFMKRLRKSLPEKSITYFHCGEYGETFRRPHYHAIIFGIDFDDRELFSQQNGVPLYTSKKLSKVWPHGFSTLGNVTFESAAYVARYVLKKINGEQAEKHYQNLIIETGELYPIQSEYITMSLKKPIGKGWYEKYSSDVFPSDEIILRGKMLKPPKYYDKLFDIQNPEAMAKIKGLRILQQKKNKADNTPARLNDKRICKEAQLNQLKRTL